MIIFWISAGSLADEQHQGLAVEPLDLVLLGVAVAAVDAEGLLDDIGAVLGGEVFGHPGPGRCGRRSPSGAALTIIWWLARPWSPCRRAGRGMPWCSAIFLPKVSRCWAVGDAELEGPHSCTPGRRR